MPRSRSSRLASTTDLATTRWRTLFVDGALPVAVANSGVGGGAERGGARGIVGEVLVKRSEDHVHLAVAGLRLRPSNPDHADAERRLLLAICRSRPWARATPASLRSR